MGVRVDFTNVLNGQLGANGISQSTWERALSELRPAYDRLQHEKQAGKLGFCRLPYQDEELLAEIERAAEAVRKQSDYLVVIGIGGSDLGTRAVLQAIGAPNGITVHFVGDTTDPQPLRAVLDAIQADRTTVAMVSKSGNTIEQMGVFLIVRQHMLDRIGEEATRARIITITDANGGTLRDITNQEGYRSFAIPGDVGGRFSVLSTVGLFPLAVAGVNIRALLEGARAMDGHDRQAEPESNLPFQYAMVNWLAYEQQGRNITICMPYVYRLRQLCFWFRQLWAESLGKAVHEDGSPARIGQTPIASLGPTDQHSQAQLYMEGPDDKLVTFVHAAHEPDDLTIPHAFPHSEGVSYLGGHSLKELLDIEQASTAEAMLQAGRPNLTIWLEKVDEQNLGELFYFFELAVVYLGYMLRVNPFDQPGVELGKRIMRQKLGQ